MLRALVLLAALSGSAAAAPFRVVLDAGHGGSNTGSPGIVEGVYEKRFTLALTRRVAEKLAAHPGIEVVMTRTGDRYLSLRERVRLANRAGGDLFLSLHANASPGGNQRGHETWILTPEALTVDARAMRHGDGPARSVDSALAALLDDLERGAAAAPSARLAALVDGRLTDVWGPGTSRGVRQGAMDVLIGLTMPGALVEVGFFDHPEDGPRLLTHDTREKLADALVRAILDFRASSSF